MEVPPNIVRYYSPPPPKTPADANGVYYGGADRFSAVMMRRKYHPLMSFCSFDSSLLPSFVPPARVSRLLEYERVKSPPLESFRISMASLLLMLSSQLPPSAPRLRRSYQLEELYMVRHFTSSPSPPSLRFRILVPMSTIDVNINQIVRPQPTPMSTCHRGHAYATQSSLTS
ncbi:hypothetical protein BDN71DRAFT_1453326 [Pleurotus eryngii]|uniref:Uncharacterized protein n=1 Tax=Pleurotus eryngii TaxID=5323 RepID=A0A9P5ZRU2_PLEER|nr:hypothetical protein BDN71DRAFT_1453326 [Pleurotus eryngii]